MSRYWDGAAASWLQDAVAAEAPERAGRRGPIFPIWFLIFAMTACVVAAGVIFFGITEAQDPKGDAVYMGLVFVLLGLGCGVWLFLRMRASKSAAQEDDRPRARQWGHIIAYLQAYPALRQNAEDNAALDALNASYRIAGCDAWASPLLDKYAARVDLAGELHAVLDAAQDIASVRSTVGPRPPEAYAHQWEIETAALDRLGAQVRSRANVLLQYESTIMRVQKVLDETLSDIAHQDRRRAAASAVDGLVRRRGGDELAAEIAAGHAAEADAAEAAVRVHLQAAHMLKTEFDLPFSITR